MTPYHECDIFENSLICFRPFLKSCYVHAKSKGNLKSKGSAVVVVLSKIFSLDLANVDVGSALPNKNGPLPLPFPPRRKTSPFGKRFLRFGSVGE